MYVPLSFTVADFNGDGKSDLATIFTHRTDNTVKYVTVMLGNGNGTFRSQMRLSEEDLYASIGSGDIDNDLNVDLVIPYEKLYIGVFLGNGDGTFKEMILIYAAGGLRSNRIIFAKFNTDNYLDIVLNRNAMFLIIYGSGNGSFSNVTLDTSHFDLLVDYGDFNNDSYLDIVMIDNEYHYVSAYLGYGNGTFQPQKGFFIGYYNEPYLSIVCDLNSDARLDIVLSYQGENNVLILFGYGDGAFSEKRTLLIGSQLSYFSSIATGDLNEDGFIDVIFSESNPYAIYVLFGSNGGVYETQTIFLTKTRYPFAFNAAADFNGDNHQDLIVIGDGSDTFKMLLNTCKCCKSQTLKNRERYP